MVNDIYNELCRSVKSYFEGASIFQPKVKQGFKKGDFVVYLKTTKTSPIPAGLEKFTLTFVVEKHDEELDLMYDSIYRLEKALGLIEIDEDIKLKGYIVSTKIKDEVLSMEVSYTFYGKAEQYKEFMEELKFENE